MKKERGRREEKEMHYIERADGLSDIYIRNQVRSVLQIDSIVFSFPISLNPHEDTSDNI